ncbi:MAG: ComEC/Rec2 family competence protein [Brevinema sp.]
MKYIFLILLLTPTASFAQVQGKETLRITSFPNITPQDTFRVSAGEKTIEFAFPVDLSPFAEVEVFGKKYHSLLIVQNKRDLKVLSENSFLRRFSDFRNKFSSQILESFHQAPLILALILGNKSFLPEEFQYSVRIVGLSHIFALSGLHLAIFLSFFYFMFHLLKIPARYQVYLLLVPALLYAFLGGLGVSLQRSLLFFLIGLILLLIRVPLSLFKVWLLALLIHLSISPNLLFTPSFLLSYTAILGIVASLRWQFFPKYLGWYFGGIIQTSLGVFLFITPVVLHFFAYINLGSFFVGILILPILPIIIALCFFAILMLILGFEVFLIDKILELCYNLISRLSFEVSSSIPTIFFTEQTKQTVIIIWVLVLILLMIFQHQRGVKCGQTNI